MPLTASRMRSNSKGEEGMLSSGVPTSPPSKRRKDEGTKMVPPKGRLGGLGVSLTEGDRNDGFLNVRGDLWLLGVEPSGREEGRWRGEGGALACSHPLVGVGIGEGVERGKGSPARMRSAVTGARTNAPDSEADEDEEVQVETSRDGSLLLGECDVEEDEPPAGRRCESKPRGGGGGEGTRLPNSI